MFPELANALNQGVEQGQENPVGVLHHYNLNDFQEHMALACHVYNVMIHVVKKDRWDAMTPNQQHIVRGESAAAGANMLAAVQARKKRSQA